jgi:hypothetical protein
MVGLVCVVACVTVRRRIAAADLAARLAHPEVHPPVTGLQTLLAARNRALRLEDDDLIEMRADSYGYTITR